MKFSVFQVSRRGGRDMNEDRMGYSYTREASLFVLADGMGGHPEGEVAAQLALQAVSALFHKQARPQVGHAGEFLASALVAAHQQIVRHAGQRGMLDTPRTTLVAALVQDGAATWVHCGDSRLYLVRDGVLLARTRDHSFLEQHHSGVLRTAAPAPINRNILFTCLGSPARPVYDIGGPLPLLQGDKLLLCSDGLWDNVSDEDIVRRLADQPVHDAVPALVEAALRAGGPHCDNVTAIAVEWETPDADDDGHAVSTDSIRRGVYASTIEPGLAEGPAADLDDDAIERSIAEINEAIRRSTPRKS